MVAGPLFQPESVPDNDPHVLSQGSENQMAILEAGCSGSSQNASSGHQSQKTSLAHRLWPTSHISAVLRFGKNPSWGFNRDKPTLSHLDVFKIGIPNFTRVVIGFSLYSTHSWRLCIAHVFAFEYEQTSGFQPFKIVISQGEFHTEAKPARAAYSVVYSNSVQDSLSVAIPATIRLLQPVPTAPVSLSPASLYPSAAKGKAFWKAQHHQDSAVCTHFVAHAHFTIVYKKADTQH